MREKATFARVKPNDVSVYVPPGHDDTYNRRLVGPEMGADHLEVILGEMGPRGTADPHVHAGSEQVIYLLEGTLRVICDGLQEMLGPGEIAFFPAGLSHQIRCESGRARFLVIFAPPKPE